MEYKNENSLSIKLYASLAFLLFIGMNIYPVVCLFYELKIPSISLTFSFLSLAPLCLSLLFLKLSFNYSELLIKFSNPENHIQSNSIASQRLNSIIKN